jgi:DHA1 family bicyclomycin/chloramphenicol resistance-like MFS transporter
VLFVIGSAGCALAGSAWAVDGWRVVQAVGACAGVVLARAMVRDLYEDDRAAQMLSTLMTAMAIAPLLGPVLGGQILALAGWRAIFLDAGRRRPADARRALHLARDAVGQPAQPRAAGPGAAPLRRAPPPRRLLGYPAIALGVDAGGGQARA